MSPSGAQPAGLRFGRRALLSLFCLLATAVSAVVAWPALHPMLNAAAEAARGANPSLLVLAGVLFAAGPLCCGFLWQHAIVRAGGRLGHIEACARYGIGSLVNSAAPAHAGDIVRTTLLLSAVPNGRRGIVRCFASVQFARVVALATLAAASALPLRFGVGFMLATVAALFVLRPSTRRLLAFALLALAAKVGASALVLVALDVPAPVRAAIAVVPALELAAVFPLTPANIGVASAAASVALHVQGVPVADAIPASIVLHAVESAAGVVYGLASAAIFLGRRVRPEWAARTDSVRTLGDSAAPATG